MSVTYPGTTAKTRKVGRKLAVGSKYLVGNALNACTLEIDLGFCCRRFTALVINGLFFRGFHR